MLLCSLHFSDFSKYRYRNCTVLCHINAHVTYYHTAKKTAVTLMFHIFVQKNISMRLVKKMQSAIQIILQQLINVTITVKPTKVDSTETRLSGIK